MIATSLLLLVTSVQGPSDEPTWTKMGQDPARPEAIVVTGRVELTPAAARAAAREEVAREARFELERRGEVVVDEVRPFWMPSIVGNQALATWLRRFPAERTITVVAADTRAHDHGGYRSFQTRLLIEPDADGVRGALRSLRGSVREQAEFFLFKCGGTVALWGVLGVAYFWFDRVTRGYMTWRLRALFSAIGVALPALAFVLV